MIKPLCQQKCGIAYCHTGERCPLRAFHLCIIPQSTSRVQHPACWKSITSCTLHLVGAVIGRTIFLSLLLREMENVYVFILYHNMFPYILCIQSYLHMLVSVYTLMFIIYRYSIADFIPLFYVFICTHLNLYINSISFRNYFSIKKRFGQCC